MPNRSTFHLAFGVAAATIIAAGGARMWATRYLMEGKQSGVLHGVAAVTKGVLG